MVFQEEIPPELLDKNKKEEFLLWLASLPVDIQTKKYIYMEWCELVGVAVDEEDIERITGWQAEWTRG